MHRLKRCEIPASPPPPSSAAGSCAVAFGFGDGFELYETVNQRKLKANGDDHLQVLAERGVAWMGEHRNEPFALFLHTYEVHSPYDAPQRYRPLFDGPDAVLGPPLPVPDGHAATTDSSTAAAGDAIDEADELDMGVALDDADLPNRRGRYATQIRYVDDFFGEVLRGVSELGLDDELIVIFISDHGESLGDHGLAGHNHFYREQLRVPLVMRIPGEAPAVLDDPVQLIDIMPTLLPLLGVEAPYKLQGVDLTRVLGGRGLPRDRLRVAENKGGVGLLRGPWKLIYYEDRRPAELFHVGDDPQELHSVLQQHPEIAESLRADYARLQERSARLARRFKITEDSRRLNPKAERELRALGYIQ